MCFTVFKLTLNNKLICSEACQPSVAFSLVVIITHMGGLSNLFYSNTGIYSQQKSEFPADDGVVLLRFVYFSSSLCIFG